jgi:hypothetical protein
MMGIVWRLLNSIILMKKFGLELNSSSLSLSKSMSKSKKSLDTNPKIVSSQYKINKRRIVVGIRFIPLKEKYKYFNIKNSLL